MKVRTLSDAPSWALNYWSDQDAAPANDVAAAALRSLAAARRALPPATFKVVLNDAEIAWSDLHGYVV